MGVFKLICCIVMIAGCSYAGFYKAAAAYERLELLQDVKQCICNLQISMEHTGALMPAALAACTFPGCHQGVVDFFREAAAAAERGRGNMGELWKLAFDKTPGLFRLTQKDRDLLSGFAANLGTTAIAGQRQNFSEINARLKRTIDDLRPQTEKKGRMYRSVGILGGLALAVVFI